MLGELERKLTAIIGDGLAGRPHVLVSQAVLTPAPEAGQTALGVGLTGVRPFASFAREALAFSGTRELPRSRRVLALRFAARLGFQARPDEDSAEAVAATRGRLLDDFSLAGHLLAAEPIRQGSAFLTALDDPGFSVRCFDFAAGSLEESISPDGLLRGELRYRGEAAVWPPGASSEERPLRVDVVLEPQPVSIEALSSVVAPSGGTTVTVALASSMRLRPEGDERVPLELAVSVLGDLPPGQRGTIVSGSEGGEAGVRIVAVTPPRTSLDYVAPASPGRAGRIEYVAVHLATPDRLRGLFLGSTPIRVLPEAPT